MSCEGDGVRWKGEGGESKVRWIAVGTWVVRVGGVGWWWWVRGALGYMGSGFDWEGGRGRGMAGVVG